MSNIKIPEGWIFREFVCEGERTKFVYDDEFGDEHIYYEYKEHIPTYKELEERIDKAIEILSEDFRKCPMSLTLEKSYIIEQDKIKKALNILKGSEE